MTHSPRHVLTASRFDSFVIGVALFVGGGMLLAVWITTPVSGRSPSGRATHEQSQQAVSALRVSIPNVGGSYVAA